MPIFTKKLQIDCKIKTMIDGKSEWFLSDEFLNDQSDLVFWELSWLIKTLCFLRDIAWLASIRYLHFVRNSFNVTDL